MRDNSAAEHDSGYARIETGKASCYSSSGTALEFIFDETDDVKLVVSQNLKPRDFSVEREKAEAFLAKIFAILEKPEVLSEYRCTIYYSLDFEWKNLQSAPGEKSGKVSSTSNEFPREALEEFVAEFKNEKTKAQAQAIPAKGVHRHTLEIYDAVKDFAKKYL